ncbi:MAG: hypothetical protein ACYC64_02135 [Armatimonadota bacterium]
MFARRIHIGLSCAITIALVLCIAPANATSYSYRTFSNLSMSGIYFTSTFWGYQSAVNRDYTGGQPAYDYSVHLIVTGEDTGQRLRMFECGRWKHGSYDGDHILQYTSPYGAANTWSMWSQDADMHKGQESGAQPTDWWYGNVCEPEVVLDAANNRWMMYTQVEIAPGQHVDTGETAAIQADRIQMAWSSDCKNWNRWTERSAIINVPDPTHTMLHHEEVIKAPWDTVTPWWMWVDANVNGVMQATYLIKSNDPCCYDYNNRQQVDGFAQLGNQVGWISDVNGAPLLLRITFADNGAGRTVPTIMCSRDGLNWYSGNEGAVLLEGSTDNLNNKNCYFLGMGTINGTGELPFYGINSIGNKVYRVIYGATTSNAPVVMDIFYSEVGVGELYLEIYE